MMHVATATALDGGICRCDECGEIMLEDERHLHEPEESTRAKEEGKDKADGH